MVSLWRNWERVDSEVSTAGRTTCWKILQNKGTRPADAENTNKIVVYLCQTWFSLNHAAPPPRVFCSGTCNNTGNPLLRCHIVFNPIYIGEMPYLLRRCWRGIRRILDIFSQHPKSRKKNLVLLHHYVPPWCQTIPISLHPECGTEGLRT